jgi:hypothetical protein
MFFDRYVFPIIPLLAVLCVIGVPRSQSSWRAARVAALAVLAIYGAFGVAGTRDYFEWRRVHWAAVERVRDSGAYAVADIDGGLEFTRDNTKEVQPPTSPKVVVTLVIFRLPSLRDHAVSKAPGAAGRRGCRSRA